MVLALLYCLHSAVHSADSSPKSFEVQALSYLNDAFGVNSRLLLLLQHPIITPFCSLSLLMGGEDHASLSLFRHLQFDLNFLDEHDGAQNGCRNSHSPRCLALPEKQSSREDSRLHCPPKVLRAKRTTFRIEQLTCGF